jgi:GntR family transcriptional repressor for pyruvate dehydrogenase complex
MALPPASVHPLQAASLAPQRLTDRLAARLIAQIEQGTLKPGERLPTEAELSRAHGVSRSVVREAVHQAKSRGLLLSRQGSGVYVAPAPVRRPLQFDPAVLESIDAVLQVVELRRVLEGEMAALAAERATRAQVAGLRRALRAMDAATDAGRLGVEEDFAFHRAIGEATANPQFVRLLAYLEQYLLDAMRVTKSNESLRPGWARTVRAEHDAIVAGIAARDPQAARRAAVEHHRQGVRRLEQVGIVGRQRGGRRT